MKDKLQYVKILVLALGIGIIVGLLDVIFGKGLLFLSSLREQNVLFFIPFLPVAGLFIIFLYRHFGASLAQGMTLVFESSKKKDETISWKLIPLVTITTWLTHLFGGSAGREGVAVQIGATVGNRLGHFFDAKDMKRTLLICGMAAGFAGLFQTPIAAVFFALEVLMVGNLYYRALLPAMIASFGAYAVSTFLQLEHFSFHVLFEKKITIEIVLQLVLLGLIFGMVGKLFIILLHNTKHFFSKIIKDEYKRIFFIGMILSILLLILFFGRYSGLGTNLIEKSFHSGEIYQWDWILKLLLTVATLSIGFQGGEVTPLFAIGSSLGVVLSFLFGMPIEFVAALGYVAVFGSATNTLIAPIIIGCELFGFALFPYFFVVCSIAFVCNGNLSIYKKQQIQEEI